MIQVGQYLLGAYRKQITARKDTIQLIIPVIYYHGTEDWNPGRIEDLITYCPENLKVFVLDFDYIFQNITLLSDEDIQDLEDNLLVPGLLIQKYFKNLKKLEELLEVIFYQLSLIEDEGNYKQNYFVYIFELFDKKKEIIMKRVEELEYPTRDRTKNYILQLVDQGFEKGIEKGVVNLLKKGESIEFICEVMEVSSEYVTRVRDSMDK